MKQIKRTLERMLKELVAWGQNCNLKFNPDKTVVVHFTRKRRMEKVERLRK